VTRGGLAAAAILVVVAAPVALAQSRGTAARTEFTLFAGAGGAVAGSNPGIDRSTGAAFVGGAEVGRPGRAGLLGRLALRLEGGYASQGFAMDGDVIGGDVQTVHGALALRVGVGRGGAPGRLAPYALAGAVVARPSTRVALREDPRSTPGARFEQVTHETVPGALLGAGVEWRAWRAALRAEARWMTIATTDRRTTMIPLLLTIALPVGR
jgi:hypothetical protein